MSKEIKGNQKHLTLSDRIYIEQSLYDNTSFRSIASFLHKDPSTISKEIRLHKEIENRNYLGTKNCINIRGCHTRHLCEDSNCNKSCRYCNYYDCTLFCDNWSPKECSKLKKSPYVCNGCPNKRGCRRIRYFYRASNSQKRYDSTLRKSRQGINMTPEELKRLDELVSPLILNGQPLSHIYSIYKDEIGCSRRTLYNYLDHSILKARNIDLHRRVRYKKRRKISNRTAFQQSYRSKRTFRDFERFMEAHSDYDVVEMDTVKGGRNAGKCMLTLMFRNSGFMLIFLLNRCSQDYVTEVINNLTEILGITLFRKTFPVILTDNGPEFKNPDAIEKMVDGRRRTYVFYCDPYVSNQKARLEKNHEYIRYVIPKGKSMYSYVQQDMNLLASHINSTARDSMNGNTPFDLAELLLDKKVPTLLGLHKVSADKVHLKPALINKK